MIYIQIIIGVLSGLLTIFINYLIGKPGGDFSTHEIFSSYTIWLSERRLKRMDVWRQYAQQYNDGIKRTTWHHEVVMFKNDFKKIIYQAAEPFFTWERAVGMCPVCTGVWVSVAAGLYFTQNLLYLLIIVLVSHIVIRIINKLL